MREMHYFGNRAVECMDTTSKQHKENKAWRHKMQFVRLTKFSGGNQDLIKLKRWKGRGLTSSQESVLDRRKLRLGIYGEAMLPF